MKIECNNCKHHFQLEEKDFHKLISNEYQIGVEFFICPECKEATPFFFFDQRALEAQQMVRAYGKRLYKYSNNMRVYRKMCGAYDRYKKVLEDIEASIKEQYKLVTIRNGNAVEYVIQKIV